MGIRTIANYKINDRKHFSQEEWVMYRDEENVPPIVSEELWEKANLILDKRSAAQSSENRTSYQNRYPYIKTGQTYNHNRIWVNAGVAPLTLRHSV